MELQHGMFTAKLRELEQEYSRLQSRIQLLQGDRREQIRMEREQLESEWPQASPAFGQKPSAPAAVLPWPGWHNSSETMPSRRRPCCQTGCHKRNPDDRSRYQDDAEMMALYTEFAIDFATQSMRYALMAALRAAELKFRQIPAQRKGTATMNEVKRPKRP